MTNKSHLSRRDFLKVGGAASVGFVLSSCSKVVATEVANTTTPIVTSTAKPTSTATSTPQPRCDDLMELAEMPLVKGERYWAQVPDTFDLQERAKLALRAMTSCTDSQNHYAPYDNFQLWRNPPAMYNTTMLNGKYMEATALLRFLTGSEENRHVDQTWRRVLLETVVNGEYPWWGIDGGRLLAWLGNNYRLEKSACWQELAAKTVRFLADRMVDKGDYCYYPDDQGTMPTGWEGTWSGWVVQGLTHLYLATHSAEALELAGKLVRYLKEHAQVFDDEAHFLARHPSENGLALHFHHNGNALEGIAAYALAANDQECVAFARSGYEWARSLGSSLVGFFPEYINDWPDDRPYIDCETCCTADMIQLAMTLSQIGEGDYWDDVDRYVRNQFAEMQLLQSDWIDRMVTKLPPAPLETGKDDDRVSERILGSFASWATANDWYIQGQPGTTFCCIGNGARALYYVWEKMLGFRDGTLSVHLLLNRASSWGDINSYLPYQGRVDIMVKMTCDIEVRIPEWVRPNEVIGFVNGVQKELTFRGRYAQLGHVEAGSSVEVNFPVVERTVKAVIGNVPYTLIIKGNEVVSIDPPGSWYPFYQRAYYRENKVQWINRERFVPAT